MKKYYLLFLALGIMIGGLSSCDDDDDNDDNSQENLSIHMMNLPDLGDDYVYEGWLIVNGSAKSGGRFSVSGDASIDITFTLDDDIVEGASVYVLTIEPASGDDPAPSSTHILAGEFMNNVAALTMDHPSALGTNFTMSTGEYILATPSDDDDSNENSGVWFLDPSVPSAGLNLPILPNGWNYEGWAVIKGTPVSTGTFTSISMADDNAQFSGNNDTPPFPGEDFLMNAPDGLSFPTDLSGGTIVISVEPDPDNSAAPFSLKPLVGAVPESAEIHFPYSMMNNAGSTNTSGTVSRK